MKTYSNIKEFVDSKKAVSIYDQEYEEYVSSIETHVFSETVSLFLNDVSNSKLFDLDAKVFHASSYLPHSLKSEFLKHEILKINLELDAFNTIRINDIKGDYDGAFLKDLVELVFDENYSFNCYMKIKSNQQFIGVYNSCDGDMEKIFPCFDKITNNLALLKHYQGLLSNYDEILSGGTIKNPYIVRFMINLADTKLINLFNSLITNTF